MSFRVQMIFIEILTSCSSPNNVRRFIQPQPQISHNAMNGSIFTSSADKQIKFVKEKTNRSSNDHCNGLRGVDTATTDFVAEEERWTQTKAR